MSSSDQVGRPGPRVRGELAGPCGPRMRTLAALGAALCSLLAIGAAQAQAIGAASCLPAPRSGDKPPPPAPMRTEAMLKTAAQTNQWYSTLIFHAQPEALYAHPLSVKTTPAGFEFVLPGKQVLPTERQDVEIHYAHRNALRLSPMAFEPGPAKLAKVSDWAIDISFARGADELRATVAKGSPYAYLRLTRGDLRLTLPSAGERLFVGAGSAAGGAATVSTSSAPADPRVLALRVGGKAYALFGPTGVRWEPTSPTEWIARLPAGAGFVAAAAMPDERPDTLQLLTRHAYAFVTDTRVDWQTDVARSQVETTFAVKTQVMEGADHGPLLGLYPHHWHNNPAVAGKLGPAFDTLRGPIKLLPAAQFKSTLTYPGFVPHWPGVTQGPKLDELADLLKIDLRKRRELIPERENKDNWRTSAYWQGKGFTRATQLAAVAEQQGDAAGRDQVLGLVKERMEYWFRGQGRSYFHCDARLGTIVSYPDEFFAVEQMNDHHFHYGYWIRAAAEVALRDPAWAAPERWGGMIERLVADIATTERGRADFPFLRTFDVYEGHSWASGVGLGEWGNNQESSSEAVNAWAALILWGEVTGNAKLRDLGMYLLSAETQAIDHYWFDLHRLVLPPEYKNVEVSMLFGGKIAHNTWWTDEPRQIHGINLLPIAPFSTYLGRDPAFIKRNLGALPAETAQYKARGKLPPNPPPADIWQDIFAKYLALADPSAALAQWDRYGSVEMGETRAHTLHWMLALNEMGTPDLSVSADTPLYQVFKRADGKRTHLAYNAGKAAIQVRFSDGVVLGVAPGALGRSR